MTNQAKQIIPDPQSVVRCLDYEAISALDSHSTFTIEELIEKINQSLGNPLKILLSNEILNFFLHKVRVVPNYGPPDFHKDINDATKLLGKSISTTEVARMFNDIRNNRNYSCSDLFEDVNDLAFPNEDTTSILSIFSDGTQVLLLLPDGNGWRQGELKICFEFTPEEEHQVLAKDPPIEDNLSPLDEIRYLANNLPIEQN
jgi:hypothetical protein